MNSTGACLGLAATAICLVVAGCTFNAGRGGTGELVVPRERLRAVEPATMEQIESSAPKAAKANLTTLPTTLPAPLQEQREVSLTIEEARRLALENNLDLRVELFEPAV